MSHQSGLSRGKGRHQKTVGLLKKVVSHQTVLSLWVSRGRGRYRNTRGLLKKGCVSPNCSFTLGFTWKRTISEDERSLCVSRNCSFTLGFTWKRTISEDERSLKEGLCLPKVVFHSGFHYLIYVHIHIRDYLQRPWELTMLIGGPDLQFCRPSHKYVFVEFSFIATSNHAR